MRAVTVRLPGLSLQSPTGTPSRTTDPPESPALLIHRVVGFLKIASPSETAPVSKSGSDFCHGPLYVNAPNPIGFPALSCLLLVFYVALVSSIYIFHAAARWAFFGIVGSLLLAYIAHWLC